MVRLVLVQILVSYIRRFHNDQLIALYASFRERPAVEPVFWRVMNSPIFASVSSLSTLAALSALADSQTRGWAAALYSRKNRIISRIASGPLGSV